MKKGLQILAFVVALGGVGFWFVAGHNPGWTKNRVEIKKKDPVTEIESMEYENRFVPGVEFLGGILGAAAVLLTISFFVRKK